MKTPNARVQAAEGGRACNDLLDGAVNAKKGSAMLKQYIEYFYPGSFVGESSAQEVAGRTPPAELPKGAYGYRFFSRSEVTQDGETLRGQPKDHIQMTYFGEVMTLEEVKGMTPAGKYKILVSNMENNRWGRVVRTIRGQFMPLNDGDSVVPPNAKISRPREAD